MNLSKLIGNRYEIQNIARDLIGRGGMGNVYRGLDHQTGRAVAIKHLKGDVVVSNPEVVARFEREGEALRRLNHPNIVSMLTTVVEQDEHYLVMEFVSGGSLSELMRREKQMVVHRVLKIGLELADALTRAHHLSIIHRDIKPANVLLAEDGTPRLTDFGVAHLGDLSRITQTGTVTGTYAYLSPEACEGGVLDARTDIWSFGALLYEMLTGRVPFEEPNLSATLIAILTKPVPDMALFRPGIPDSLANLVYEMLQKDRHKRISSVRQVGARLESIIAGLGRNQTGLVTTFETTPSETVAPVVGPRHNLPPQPTPFVGREPEVQEVLALLNDPDCRLLTLVGPGGMGKTRLSLEAAFRKVDDFQHGVRFVPLAAISSPALLPTAIAESVGVAFFENHSPKQQLFNYLREKELLLVLDNFEQLIEGAEFVSELLAHCPKLKILVTSREALNLWEEYTRPVRGMRYPDQQNIANIEPYSAVKLFAARARRVRNSFDASAELNHIIQICQLVDGMPLGIELAASWLRVLSADQIVQEIQNNYNFLSTNMRNITERHRSIRAVFDYSWNLLSPEEMAVFRKLAVFQGGFRRPAAEAIAGATLATLTSLVNKSLLYEGESHNTDTPGGSNRYTMHELLRQYANEKWRENEAEQQATERRHALYYANLLAAQEAHLKGQKQRLALELIGEERENVRLSWKWALANLSHDPETALVCLQKGNESLYIFYEARGIMYEAVSLFESAVNEVEMIPAGTTRHRQVLGKLLGCLGLFYFRTQRRIPGQHHLQRSLEMLHQVKAEEPSAPHINQDIILSLTYLSFDVARTESEAAGRELLLEAITLCQQINDKWLLARTKNALAILTSNFNQQIALYHEALAIARELGDQIVASRALINITSYTLKLPQAKALIQELADNYKRLGNPADLLYYYMLAGNYYFRIGDFSQSKLSAEKGLNYSKETGLTELNTVLLAGLSAVAWVTGNYEQARQYLEQSLAVEQEEGDLQTMVRVLCELAEFIWDSGDYHEAKKYYKQALAVAEQLMAARPKAVALDSLGNLALTLGAYDSARKHFEENGRLFQQVNDRSGEAWSWFNLGNIAFELGDYETAKQKYEESLAVHRQNEFPWNIAQPLHRLGRLACKLGDMERGEGYFREALKTVKEVWASWIVLEVLIDWCGIMVHNGERDKALAYLYVICRDPEFIPVNLKKQARDRATRLLAELTAGRSPEALAAAQAWAKGKNHEILMNEELSFE